MLGAVVFGGACAREDTGAVNASAAVAIAVRRVGFDIGLFLPFPKGLPNINAPSFNDVKLAVRPHINNAP